MAARLQQSRADRIKAATASALIVGAVGWGLVRALASDVGFLPSDALKLFAIAPPPLPPPVDPPRPEPRRQHRPNGAASPANLRAAATPIVAPPLPPRPSPVVAALKPGVGAEASAGASDRPGPGTGSGGQGTGTGSGDVGNGEGDGDGDGPELIAGGISNRDYPRDALRAGASGTVRTRFTVGMDGRVSRCVVTGSSGNAELDDITCRLIVKRFRFRPARDGSGRPIADEADGEQRWSTSRRSVDEDAPDD